MRREPIIKMKATSAAGLDGAVFYSHGHKLLGGFYRAAGDPSAQVAGWEARGRPTAILLHGVPGVEKNLDLAYALRDAGWNCLYFHYRGCWGSQGAYSFAGMADDVRAATEWVLAQPAADGERLALMGSSMGGYMTLAAGAADARFKALVPLCPLIDPAAVPLPSDMAEEFAAMLQGVTAADLVAQWAALPAIVSLAEGLAARPILLVTGDRDELFPPDHYRPLAEALPRMAWRRLPHGDHVFSACRQQLVEIVVGWLGQAV